MNNNLKIEIYEGDEMREVERGGGRSLMKKVYLFLFSVFKLQRLLLPLHKVVCFEFYNIMHNY